MSARDKINPSPTEPKKSVRLAQKRKLREESGTSSSNVSEDFVTTFSYSKTNAANRLKTSSPNLFNTSSSSSLLPSPSKENKKLKRSATESPETTSNSSSSNVNVTTPLKGYSPVSSKSPRGTSPSVINNNNLNRSSGPVSTPPSSNLEVEEDDIEEEEKWLDAIESGNLEELEDVELRQMKNPKLMTARQRAMLGKKDKDIYGFSIDDEMTNIFDKKESLAVTQEMIKLKAEKTEKRRQLAHEKKEKDKKKTMDRLLKKQDAKAGKTVKQKTSKKFMDYKITFISKPEGNIISFPVSYPLPFEKSEQPPAPPKVVLCAVNGCENRKRYSCSKTKVPLCSLECYKKNLESHNL